MILIAYRGEFHIKNMADLEQQRDRLDKMRLYNPKRNGINLQLLIYGLNTRFLLWLLMGRKDSLQLLAIAATV